MFADWNSGEAKPEGPGNAQAAGTYVIFDMAGQAVGLRVGLVREILDRP